MSEDVCFLYGVEMAIKICNALVGNDTYSADLSPPNMEKCFSLLSLFCLSQLVLMNASLLYNLSIRV